MRSARFSRGFSDYQVKMAFIMPTMILLILMNIFPLLWSLYLSFHRYKASMPNRPAKFIGVQNYARLLTDPEIWGYFQTTAYFVVLAVITQFIIGFGLALLLNREFRYKGLVTTLILLPMMLSPGCRWSLLAIHFCVRCFRIGQLPAGSAVRRTDRLDDRPQDRHARRRDCRYVDVVAVHDANLSGWFVRYPQVSLRSRRCRPRLPMVQVPLDHPAVGFSPVTNRPAVPHDGCFQDVRYCLCADPRRGTGDSDGNSFNEPVQTGVSEL